jgi:bleomycin hydrolase
MGPAARPRLPPFGGKASRRNRMSPSKTAPRKRRAGGKGIIGPSGAVSGRMVNSMRDDFGGEPMRRIVQNAVTQVSVQSIANRREVVTEADHSFSVVLDDWKATNQARSGRCWMFAALNLFRVGAMKKMKLKEFEFSQNFTLFWDKLEKANYFLEAIIDTADRDVDDRTVAFLLSQPIVDGGQWHMLVSLVKKHGLVPKAAMPETESSGNTGAMNSVLVAKLREGAKRLRDMRAEGAGMKALRDAKEDTLNVVYRILSIHLGTPPERFVWQWKDKDGKFHREAGMTPRRFADKYVGVPLDEYVCLVNDPRPQHSYGRTYSVEYLGNVVGGEQIVYLNVDVDTMKRATVRTLKDGEPVWFGCDVRKQMDGKLGVWDAQLQDYESIYGTAFGLDKAGRLQYGEARMTHAMLFTGVDLVRGKPRRWRVENSWGEDRGQKGFFLMNDSWFDEHMFEVAVHQKYLPAKLRKAVERRPVMLPPWDPMGALAG